MSQPTIGRIVHYTLNAGDVDVIRQQRAAAGMTGANSVSVGQAYPAVIVRAWGDSPTSAVNLQVLLDGPDTYWATSRTEGEGEFYWAWPPRV